MKTLSLDTSGKSQSVALLKNGDCIAKVETLAPASHTEILIPAIAQVLKEGGVALEDIDLLAGTHGPGSFTGLRIGLSTLKALALAGGKPVVGIGTLRALAAPYLNEHVWVAACLDARLGEVYGAIYQRESATGEVTTISEPQACSREVFSQKLAKCRSLPWIVGSGLETYPDLGQGDAQARVQALWVAHLAEELYSKNDNFKAQDLKPLYLRASTAEQKRLEKLEPFR